MSTITNKKPTPKTTAPVLPSRKDLPITDPRRKLTRDEWKTMSKTDKAARKLARQAARGPAKARFVKLVLRYATRFERMSKAFEKEPSIANTFNGAITNMRHVASDIDELPEAWTPAGKMPKHNFTVGMKVQLVEARVAHYKELLGEDIGDMEVINAVGKRVVVKTVKGGTRLFLEARHVKQVG